MPLSTPTKRRVKYHQQIRDQVRAKKGLTLVRDPLKQQGQVRCWIDHCFSSDHSHPRQMVILAANAGIFRPSLITTARTTRMLMAMSTIKFGSGKMASVLPTPTSNLRLRNPKLGLLQPPGMDRPLNDRDSSCHRNGFTNFSFLSTTCEGILVKYCRKRILFRGGPRDSSITATGLLNQCTDDG